MGSRRPRLLVAGVVCVSAGALLLGYVLWQYLGTNWVSQRRHADLVDRVDRAWAEERASAVVEEGEVRAVVRIPSFGADYAVPLLEGTSDDVLAAGFGHVDGTAAPGAAGNFVLAGHRVTHGEPLREMPELDVGDEVVVETASASHTYELVTAGDGLEVPFSEGWVMDPEPLNPREGGVEPPRGPDVRLLTLVTCAELFDTDDRLVAFAVLTSTAEKSAPARDRARPTR